MQEHGKVLTELPSSRTAGTLHTKLNSLVAGKSPTCVVVGVVRVMEKSPLN